MSQSKKNRTSISYSAPAMITMLMTVMRMRKPRRTRTSCLNLIKPKEKVIINNRARTRFSTKVSSIETLRNWSKCKS